MSVYNKQVLELQSKEFGFQRDTFEKICRLIKELLGISLDGENALFSLLMSYRITDYYTRLEIGVKQDVGKIY